MPNMAHHEMPYVSRGRHNLLPHLADGVPRPDRGLRPAETRMAGWLQSRLVNAAVGNEVAIPCKGLVNIAGGQAVVGQFISVAFFALAAP